MLTVEQVIGVTNGLSTMGRYDGVCKTGADERACIKTYDLSGPVRWTIATNITAGKQALKDYQDACEELSISMGGTPGAGCGTTVPNDRLKEFNVEVRKLMAAPSHVTLGHIKKDDLKLDVNQFPADVLSLVMPIID